MTVELDLADAFKQQVDRACPKVGMLLHCCYVKCDATVFSDRIDRTEPSPGFHLTLYCPSILFAAVKAHQDILNAIAQRMGGTPVLCLNAKQNLRDAVLNLSQANPKLWLILRWLENTLTDQETECEDRTLLHLRKSLSGCPSSDHRAECSGTTCRSVGF